MIVLHAGKKGDELLIWGETSASDAGRGPAATKLFLETYPYDAGKRALLQAFRAASIRLRRGRSRVASRDVVLWLPTRGGKPIPSSPLIAEPPSARGKPTLARWRVTTHPLRIGEAIELLCHLAGRRVLAPGVVVSEDLAFWTEALRFAGSLVARQRYLPGMVARNGSWQARWEPVLEGADAGELARLKTCFPPVGRAFSDAGAESPPQTPAMAELEEFLAGSVDYLVRASIAGPTPPRRRGRPKRDFASVHDRWLHALRAPDGAMSGDASELRQLARAIRQWRRPIAGASSVPLRLCFRLEEPEVPPVTRRRVKPREETWYVRYLVQPHEDPSLLIPLDEAWNGGGRKPAGLQTRGARLREFLLSSLGTAARMFPELDRSLDTAVPSGCELTTDAAHRFLNETAIALEEAGFGVLLPAWWTRKGSRSRLSLRARVESPKMKGGGFLTLDTVVAINWEVALGGEKLTLRELEALARRKAPLVRIRGQWVELSSTEIEQALELWKKKALPKAALRDVVEMALGARRGPSPLPVESVTADGWIGAFLKRLEGRSAFEELPAPRGFSGTLRPYQLRGYSWLSFLGQWGLGACLADDMGLGKTVQTLALIQRARKAEKGRPFLIVCPTSVITNWQREAARFTPELPVLVHHGLSRKRGRRFQKEAKRNAVVVSSYALLHRDLDDLRGVPWAGVILDEAQNIKNPATKQARAARSLEAGYRIGLTGTPVENNVGDLWSIMEFLNPGLLGSEAAFKRNFFLPIQAGRDEEAAKRLQQLTGPFLLRRLKTDPAVISDLPEKLEMKVYCPLTREQASLYRAVLRDLEDEIASSEGIQRKGLILATLSKLKQVCNHPAHFLGDGSRVAGRSGKLSRLTEMLEEALAVGDRALVFSQFYEMGAILKRHLEESFGEEALFLHGGVPKARRDRMVERFQSGSGPRFFVLSLKAGGTGLNLTAASRVCHFDRWWNPAVEDQATDRAFRIGQTKRVQVHKLVCGGTLEERIDEMIERKKAVAEKVVGKGEGWLTELSNRELRDVLALGAEAVVE